MKVDAPTLREAVFALTGAALSLALVFFSNDTSLLTRISAKKKRVSGRCSGATIDSDDDDTHIIRTVEELRAVLPPVGSGSGLLDCEKVISHLDDQMIDFVARSPFLQLATVSADGMPSVSPKGDAAGFVVVEKDCEGRGVSLLIPDRHGNRLLLGLQNLLANPQLAILFEIPGTRTTLRCGGVARISRDPALLRTLAARGVAPTVTLVMEIRHAFFHCAKAYMRSGIWDPRTWPEDEYRVGFGKYWFPEGSIRAKGIDQGLAKHYDRVQQAIDGKCCEEG